MMHGYNHNTDDKAQLINDNLDIVKKIAFFYVGRVGKVVEVDDLLQLGMVGLIEAAHNYTPQDDVSFVNYARLRVKGVNGGQVVHNHGFESFCARNIFFSREKRPDMLAYHARGFAVFMSSYTHASVKVAQPNGRATNRCCRKYSFCPLIHVVHRCIQP